MDTWYYIKNQDRFENLDVFLPVPDAGVVAVKEKYKLRKKVQTIELGPEEFYDRVLEASQGYYNPKVLKACTYFKYLDENGNHIELILKEDKNAKDSTTGSLVGP